jgi:hypothetical protein
MARAIREYNPYSNLQKIVATEHEANAESINTSLEYLASSEAWQYKAISDLFRPICYSTGKCEFMASADRKCTIRDRVQANHSIGRPSSEWDKDLNLGYPQFGNPPMPAFNSKGEQILPAIYPEEWLRDPTAAR